jgi:DNA-binding protein YbaB
MAVKRIIYKLNDNVSVEVDNHGRISIEEYYGDSMLELSPEDADALSALLVAAAVDARDTSWHVRT